MPKASYYPILRLELEYLSLLNFDQFLIQLVLLSTGMSWLTPLLNELKVGLKQVNVVY